MFEIQPDYPKVDLTQQNVQFLREFLLKPNLTHTISPENPDGHLEDFLTQFDLVSQDSGLEAERLLHTAAHEVMLDGSATNALTTGRIELTYGYTLQGILTEIISPKELLTNSVPLADALRSLTRSVRNRSLPEFLDATKKEFLQEQKNTVRLIGESASKMSVYSPENAILGASIRRRIELDSRDYLEHQSE